MIDNMRPGLTDADRPVVIVTSDTHVGPRPAKDLASYCPSAYRREWEQFVEDAEEFKRAQGRMSPIRSSSKARHFRRNLATKGHYDVRARLDDMNTDGIAAEVIFHGSQNGEVFPFRIESDPSNADIFRHTKPADVELAAVGIRMYNRWLADFVSAEPERHVGLAHIPIWDIDGCIAEIEWAKAAGLRGVNFPSPQSYFPQYNEEVWEKFWAAAESLQMPLVTHIGSGSDVVSYTGIEGMAIGSIETAATFGRRGIWWLIFSGVFARHPSLRLVITENPGDWWPQLEADLDSSYRAFREMLGEKMPEPASYYLHRNVFVGASFLCPSEARSAQERGHFTQYMWGSDYPHAEGTYQYPDEEHPTSNTRRALRHAFSGLDRSTAEAMAGGNAISVYGLDLAALEEVAARIHAPSWNEINWPLTAEELPADAGILYNLAFRSHGVWD
jgi:predicted TIM-barrel fold metal-dependent hydrolase